MITVLPVRTTETEAKTLVRLDAREDMWGKAYCAWRGPAVGRSVSGPSAYKAFAVIFVELGQSTLFWSHQTVYSIHMFDKCMLVSLSRVSLRHPALFLALNSQGLDPNNPRIFAVSLPRDDKILCPRAIFGYSVYTDIISFACFSYGVHNVGVLSVPVPVDRIQDLDLGARRIPVLDQLGYVLCSSKMR